MVAFVHGTDTPLTPTGPAPVVNGCIASVYRQLQGSDTQVLGGWRAAGFIPAVRTAGINPAARSKKPEQRSRGPSIFDWQVGRFAKPSYKTRPTKIDAALDVRGLALGQSDQEMPDGKGSPAGALAVAIEARIDFNEIEAGDSGG